MYFINYTGYFGQCRKELLLIEKNYQLLEKYDVWRKFGKLLLLRLKKNYCVVKSNNIVESLISEEIKETILLIVIQQHDINTM